MNSKYYNNGILTIALNDYLNVFNAVKRELDINIEDDRYDYAIEASIADNVFRLSKQELFPNQQLLTKFAIDKTNITNNNFNLELTTVSRILSLKLLNNYNNNKKCIPRTFNTCCEVNNNDLNYTVSGNLLIINNLSTLGTNINYTLAVLTNGGNIAYWLTQGWRILTQAVKADLYLNYFKSIDEYNMAQNSYLLLYRDLEKQTYDLYNTDIKINKGYL